jgi:hypothetical protein
MFLLKSPFLVKYAVFQTMKYSGFLDCVKTVFAEDGVKGFYRGFASFAAVTPVELLWPAFAWSVATVVVYAIFEEDADDEDDEDDERLIKEGKY